MARPDVSRPSESFADLLTTAAALSLEVDLPQDDQWPVWAADYPHSKRSCDDKTAYLYPEAAIARMIRVFRSTGLRLRTYACPLGRHFQVTNNLLWKEVPCQSRAS